MSSSVQEPTPIRSNGRSFDELARTNHGNISRSTRNRLPVQRQASQSSEAPKRLIPVKVSVSNGSRRKSSNTATAQWMTTKTKRGGKRKKGKTQKKRKRNNKKKQ